MQDTIIKIVHTWPVAFTLFTLITLSACAQAPIAAVSPDANAYVTAYINMEFDVLGTYYTDHSTFQDPTLALISADAAKAVKGKTAILAKLKRNFNGVTQPVYELKEAYTVGSYSIFVGVYSYVQNATAFGGPDVDIHFSLKSTTILEEVDGKIVAHTEYMDYGSWFKQFEAQKNGK